MIKSTFSRFFGLFALASSFMALPLAAQESNALCPMMTEDEIDSEEVVDFKGNEILLCCGRCSKLWKSSETAAAYWAKVATELGLLPQLKGKEKELGFDEIELIDQRFSAVSYKTIITPESPTVEYNGKKYHVLDDREVRRWERNPEEAYNKAVEAGVIK